METTKTRTHKPIRSEVLFTVEKREFVGAVFAYPDGVGLPPIQRGFLMIAENVATGAADVTENFEFVYRGVRYTVGCKPA